MKPAPQTPLSALALARLAERAGIPAGVINIITSGDKQSTIIGEVLTTDPLIRKFSFTGSTQVGRQLMAQCASTIKRISLELGGNAPFIIFDDADLDEALEGALASKYRNSGQTCICPNRFYVQKHIHDSFISRFAERVATMKIGPGMMDDILLGPLISDQALKKVKSHIADALAKGARLVTGGKPHKLGGRFFRAYSIERC